jgi:hypothetical protein
VFFDLRMKFKLDSPAFMGVLAPTHRGFRNLTNLSLSWLQIAKDKKESKRGRIRFGDELSTRSVWVGSVWGKPGKAAGPARPRL